MKFLAIIDKNLNIGNACLIAIVCIIIVFLMLALLWGIVELFRLLPEPKKQTEPQVTPNVQVRKAISMADIKDDDMMVAALVATIDYHNETKQDVRVVSIKEL